MLMEGNYGKVIAYVLLLAMTLALTGMIMTWIVFIETSILKDVWGTKFSILLAFYIIFPIMNLTYFLKRMRVEKRFFIDTTTLNFIFLVLWDAIAVAYSFFMLLDGHNPSSLQNYLLLNFDSEIASKFVQETQCFDVTELSCWGAAGKIFSNNYTNFAIAFISMSIIQVPLSIVFIF